MTDHHDAGTSGTGDPHRPSPTILLVEDDDAVRGLLQHILDRERFVVLTAGDGPSALALARTHSGPIDLLLTDISMPRMTGRELADLIHVDRPDLPVLFMSGYADSGTIQLAQEGCREALLLKPFRPGDLALRVREMIAKPSR
jgi:CheY-like chemotaxis protein